MRLHEHASIARDYFPDPIALLGGRLGMLLSFFDNPSQQSRNSR